MLSYLKFVINFLYTFEIYGSTIYNDIFLVNTKYNYHLQSYTHIIHPSPIFFNHGSMIGLSIDNVFR
jgi:hypothetical protein